MRDIIDAHRAVAFDLRSSATRTLANPHAGGDARAHAKEKQRWAEENEALADELAALYA